jgi:hypothetical protein
MGDLDTGIRGSTHCNVGIGVPIIDIKDLDSCARLCPCHDLV